MLISIVCYNDKVQVWTFEIVQKCVNIIMKIILTCITNLVLVMIEI